MIKECINDGGVALEINKMDIINESDIEREWKNAIPYGTRKDDKTCLEIFKEEIESKKTQEEIEHPDQKKFEFVKEN